MEKVGLWVMEKVGLCGTESVRPLCKWVNSWEKWLVTWLDGLWVRE